MIQGRGTFLPRPSDHHHELTTRWCVDVAHLWLLDLTLGRRSSSIILRASVASCLRPTAFSGSAPTYSRLSGSLLVLYDVYAEHAIAMQSGARPILPRLITHDTMMLTNLPGWQSLVYCTQRRVHHLCSQVTSRGLGQNVNRCPGFYESPGAKAQGSLDRHARRRAASMASVIIRNKAPAA
nr:hypothetical protein CFP56_73989 [Quercus suber]